MKSAQPVTMWAAISRSERSEWIMPHTLAHTRRESRDLYGPDSGYVRFARVTVSIDPPVQCVPTGECLLRQR